MYCCKTTDCAIAESKARFPKQILCPGCQKLLSPVVQITTEEEELIANLPYVIAYPLHETILAADPLMKINLLKDTLQNFLKYLGLMVASEFFNSPLVDKKIVLEFNKNLAQPSFGSWNAFIRECLSFLEKENHTFFCPELPEYYKKVESGKKVKRYAGEIEIIDSNGDTQLKKQEATGIGMLINFRNRYLGHGTTPNPELSESLFEKYYPILISLLENMSFASDYIMIKKEGSDTYMLKGATIEKIEISAATEENVFLMKADGNLLPLVPFFIVPGEVAVESKAKPEIFLYESFTGKAIKFFSPEGAERSTSGRILEKLNLLLKEKSTGTPFNPSEFTQDVFISKLKEENEYVINTLKIERKVIDGIYVHRTEIEQELIGWTGARANIFFIASEAGSGKTNLLVEMCRRYTEDKLPALFIRAGRMTKATLKNELAYLLNLDPAISLDKYETLSGTQAQPFIVLLDGLNEASKPKEIWKEVLDIYKLFEPGAIKFVISNRINTSKDLDSYTTENDELERIYFSTGDTDKLKNIKENTLSSRVFQLTPLNMNEMKETWELYVQGDRKHFKPQFSFDDIALHDRNIYNQINNPLLLRVFLETYHGKSISGKKNKQMHIWRDWFAGFTREEQEFMERMADAVWNVGRNELILDDLLQNKELKDFLTTDQVNAPYPRLLNKGWISRYSKEMVVYLGFTVEGLLIYLLGLKLLRENKLNEDTVNTILEEGNQLKISALESSLNELARSNDLDLISTLIDKGGKHLELCITPLLYFLKTAGPELTVKKLLEKPTDNDWVAFLKLNELLEKLQLFKIKEDFLLKIIPINTLDVKESIFLAIKGLFFLNSEKQIKYYGDITIKEIINFPDDYYIAYMLGEYDYINEDYYSSLDHFKKALKLRINKSGNFNELVANCYHNIGKVYFKMHENDKALENFKHELKIRNNIEKSNQFTITENLIGIGEVYSKTDFNKALDYFNKSYKIIVKTYGELHITLIGLYLKFGNLYNNKGKINEAIAHYKKSEYISKKLYDNNSLLLVYRALGKLLKDEKKYNEAIFYNEKINQLLVKKNDRYSLASTYHELGFLYAQIKDYDNALIYYKDAYSLHIELFDANIFTGNLLSDLGTIYKKKEQYKEAILNYKKAAVIYAKLKDLSIEHIIISCYKSIADIYIFLQEYDKALEFFNKILKIQLKRIEDQHPDVANIYNSIGNTLKIKGEYNKAIENFKAGLKIKRIGGFSNSIASCYKALDDLEHALEYHILTVEIRKERLGIADKRTLEAINSCKNMAKELNKLETLPDWIKDM